MQCTRVTGTLALALAHMQSIIAFFASLRPPPPPPYPHPHRRRRRVINTQILVAFFAFFSNIARAASCLSSLFINNIMIVIVYFSSVSIHRFVASLYLMAFCVFTYL